MNHLGRILLSVLTIFFMAVQPSYSKVSDPSITVNPKEGQVSEEGLVRLTLPDTLIKQLLQDNVVATVATPERYLKEITHFELDPIQKLLILEGVALIPEGVVNDMDAIAGGKVFTAEHKFRLIAKLPSAQKLALTRYFVLQIVELNVGGADYTSGASRIGEFLVTMFSNTSFMDWVLADPSVPAAENPTNSEDRVSVQMKKLFDSKAIMVRNQSIYVKLDFSKIDALKSFAVFENFRLWNATPVIVKGTDIVALQVEGGLGKPGKSWFMAIKERGEGEASSLENAQADLYKQLGDVKALTDDLKSFAKVTKTNLNFPMWSTQQERQLEDLNLRIEEHVRKGLSLDNPLFKANPQYGYDNTKEETKAYILGRLSEMKRQTLAEATIINGGKKGSALPFLTQRLSQRALSQGIRFARDFQFENEQLFPELEVVLAPQIPGVVLRGLMNVDMNTFMEMGLEGEGIDWGNHPWRLAGDIWSKALPFELALRIHMFDNGEVGLDVKSFSILKGSEKIFLTKDSGHGHLMVTWTKMAIVEALTTLAIDDPAQVASEADIQNAPKVDPDQFFKHALSKIKEQVSAYSQTHSNPSGKGEGLLLKMAEIDITKNPFNQVGDQVVAAKVRYLFKDIVRYDDKTELLLFKIDPRLVAEKIYESKNTLQVWNLEALFDKGLNQTFVEASVGDGLRSKDFIHHLYTRAEKADSESFVGIDETKKTAPSDLITKMRFSYFENFLNKLFSDASQIESKKINRELSKDKEQSYNLIRDLNIGATQDGRLQMSVTFEMIEKKKNGFFARLFSTPFKVSRKSAHVAAKVNLSVKSLDKFKGQLKLAPGEVFFGNEVLSIDLESVGLKFTGDTGLLDKAIGLVAGNIDFKNSGLAKKTKVLVLNFLKGYLNSTDPKKNGNVTLGGVKINRFAKLLAHKEELLIQLNPHLMSVAFDLRTVVNEKFNDQPIGVVVSKANDSISFHFSTSGNMAAVDKGELFKIMKDSKVLFDKVITAEDNELSAKDLIFVYDRALYNSDFSKLSLFHRLNRVLRNYSGVSDLVKPDTSVVAAINRQLHTDFGLKSGEFNSRFLSGSGVEVMYFTSAAYFLKSGLDKTIARIEELNIDAPYLGDMRFKSKQLQERFINPLMDIYTKHFYKNNANMVNKGPSDWNYTYYSDALYCHNVFSIVSKITQQSGQEKTRGGKGE